jgi:hypothetical protein
MGENTGSLEAVVERNVWYAERYCQAVCIFFISLLSMLILGAFLLRQWEQREKTLYFPTTPDGKIIVSPPLDVNHLRLSRFVFNEDGSLDAWPEINKKDLDLTQEDSDEHAIIAFWSKKAVTAMFNYDYTNYVDFMHNVREYFLLRGYNKFIDALRASNNLIAVKNGSRVAWANIVRQPKVVESVIKDGRLTWTIDMGISVTYEGLRADDLLRQNLTVTMRIVRVPVLKSLFYGLGVYQVVFTAE